MNALQIRDYVAAKLVEASNWRFQKGQQYPDDNRNANSAAALMAAAEYVRQQVVLPSYDPDVPVGLRRIVALAQMLDVTNPYSEMPWHVETARIAGRFGFAYTGELLLPNGEARFTSAEGFDKLLGDLYEAMLDDVTEAMCGGSWETELTLPLAEALGRGRVRRIQNWRAGIEDDEESSGEGEALAILRDLRDLLNERLPA